MQKWKEYFTLNEASRDNLNADKRILTCEPFLHKVYKTIQFCVRTYVRTITWQPNVLGLICLPYFLRYGGSTGDLLKCYSAEEKTKNHDRNKATFMKQWGKLLISRRKLTHLENLPKVFYCQNNLSSPKFEGRVCILTSGRHRINSH